MTVHSCQAGKQVYCEKPTARTIEEGRAMVNAARCYNRVVQSGLQGRSNPNARAACDYVRNGMLGRVSRVELWHAQLLDQGTGRVAEMEHSSDEIKRLQDCINDLIGVLALSALWSGHNASQIVNTLLDGLVGMLRLDLGYARLSDAVDAPQIEIARLAQRRDPVARPHEIGQLLDRSLADVSLAAGVAMPNPVGEGELLIASFGLGLRDEIGILVVGSQRADFPTQMERLLLRVAANQAAIGLQESRRLNEQKRAAEELDKRAEEKLIESERRFRLLVESIPHHVWSFLSNGSIGYWNQRLIDYTGLTVEEVRQGGWAALHPDDMDRVKTAWQEAWTRGTYYEMEQRIRGRDGRYRRFMSRGVPVKDEEGRPVEWFGTNSDVEDRQQAQEALQKLYLELAHVSRVTTLGELAASIAHEVNQPLGAIVTNGQASLRLLAREAPDLDGAREAVEAMISDGLRASEVIRRIRGLLRKADAEYIPLDINKSIQVVTLLAANELASNQVTLRTDLEGDLSPVVGDRVQLQQVVLNLVLNANAAMSEEGWRPRELLITSRRSKPHEVTVAVQDTGPGFDPEIAERLFDAFFTTKEGGLGLGLSISRTIIEAHRGKLWATSNESMSRSKGSTFQFTLPAGGEGE